MVLDVITGVHMADDPPPAGSPGDEAGWPPRFSDRFLAWSAAALAVVFAGIAVLVYVAFDAATGEGASIELREAAALVLFVIGVLALLLGAFFALVEARKPTVQVVTTAISDARAGAPLRKAKGGDEALPGGSITEVVESFSGRRVSAVLLAIGFSLVTLAAAGSGLVSVSVGDDAQTGSPAPTPTASPT